jgi:hypothetical protein
MFYLDYLSEASRQPVVQLLSLLRERGGRINYNQIRDDKSLCTAADLCAAPPAPWQPLVALVRGGRAASFVTITKEGQAELSAVHLAGSSALAKPETNRAAQPNPPARRLTVDLARKTITLDGQTEDVSSLNALRWVKVLNDHQGEWISGKDLAKYDQELQTCRTDRWRTHLPEAIRSLIESQSGAGSRIQLKP